MTRIATRQRALNAPHTPAHEHAPERRRGDMREWLARDKPARQWWRWG